MITLVVLGILVALASPSIRTILAQNRVAATANSVVTGLNIARSTAISEAINVRICPADNSNCDASGTNWASGWQVIPDTNNDNNFTETPIRENAESNTSLSFPSTVNAIEFRPRGTSTGTQLIEICNGDSSVSDRCQRVQINLMGHISNEKYTTT